MIYESPVIIYGAGNKGFDILFLLTEAGNITVEAFCDGNANKKTYCGRKVIPIGDMAEYVAGKDYNVIIASEADYKQMIQELEVRNVKAKHVYTWWGVECALETNLHHPMVDKEFGIFYKESIKNAHQHQRMGDFLKHAQKVVLQNPEVIIFQYGKVGSSSIYDSLVKQECNCLHSHNLCRNEKDKLLQKWQERCREAVRNNGVKIITLVREPVGRFTSMVMESFKEWTVNFEAKTIKEIMQDELIVSTEECHSWFNNQIEQLTGINIFDYPFDKEKGYVIIKKDNIEILLMTLEKLNSNEATIGEFVGLKDFKLTNANVAADKVCDYVYQDIKKEFRVSEKMLDEVYETFRMEHFYSDKDIAEYKKKWLSSIK